MTGSQDNVNSKLQVTKHDDEDQYRHQNDIKKT